MKLVKIASGIFAASLVAIVGTSAVFASSPGQLTGGSQVYEVKNITQGGSYANTISAKACDVVQFSTELHNAGNGGLTNIEVKASLPSGDVSSFTSNVKATPAEGASYGTSGSSTVNLSSSQSVSYITGSTKLYNSSGALVSTLPDGITGNGVNVGNMSGSTLEWVNFQAKISCPTPPKVELACTALDVNQIDRTHYDFTAHASVQNATVQSYDFTAKDSSNSTVDTNTVNTDALSAVYHFNQSTPGTYTVSAVVNTDHGSTSASDCTKQITVASVPPTTPPTTPPAKSLPNTGAGDVLGIFTGVSSLGAVGHYVTSRRRR